VQGKKKTKGTLAISVFVSTLRGKGRIGEPSSRAKIGGKKKREKKKKTALV